MNDPNDVTPLDMLLMLQVRGDISAEQRIQLQGRIREDLGTLDYTLDFLIVCAGLEPVCQEDSAAALARLEATLEKHEVKTQASLRPVWRSSYKIAAMLVLGCLAAFAVLKMLQQSRSQGLAQIINGLAAKWEDPSIATAPGTQLGKGPKCLLEGVAQLQMASGAQILLQAPCRFALNSRNRIHLNDGTITANVPKEARGFAVETRDCTVVDHGTEFGIRVKPNTQTEIHVFSGQVRLKPSQPAPGQATEIPLKANQAALVKASAPVEIGAAKPAQFMRKLPQRQTKTSTGQQLRLADIVGGGNGFGTGKTECGIDVATGARIQTPGKASLDQQGAFIMLMGQRYIDGVFAPNRRFGHVTISTTGLIFAACPQATRCYVGGVFSRVQGNIDTQNASSPNLRVLSHQCNTGITFDLDRLRKDNPGVSIQGLDTRCRIARTTSGPGKAMDFWILVDGRLHIHHHLSTDDHKEIAINLVFDAEPRFLTLVTTCPDNTQDCWGEFVDPLLNLAP